MTKADLNIQRLAPAKNAALVEDDAAVAGGTVLDPRHAALSTLPCFPQSGEAKNQHS
jgi:hypothetical protein